MSFFRFGDYLNTPKRPSPSTSPIIPFCTSPSQLYDVTLSQDVTTNSLRSPEGVTRGRSVKEFEEQLSNLKKENFNLKLRIYFLEERMGSTFSLDKENVVKSNIELKVEIESLKKELQEKHELLCQAVKAMELQEEDYEHSNKTNTDQILLLQQENEDLKLQIQECKSENDDSSHKSYASDPIFLSTGSASVKSSGSITRMYVERIAVLEKELVQEKENSASLQILVDQSNLMSTKYDELVAELKQRDGSIAHMKDEIASCQEKITKYMKIVKTYEENLDQLKQENQAISNKYNEKSRLADEAENQLIEIKKKYVNLKTEIEFERQRYEKNKLVSEMRISELEEDGEKQKARIQDLQKKLGMTSQELKSNQSLLVSKSPQQRTTTTNTDSVSFSASNPATPPGVQKADALRLPLTPSQHLLLSDAQVSDIIKTLGGSLSEKQLRVLNQLEKSHKGHSEKVVYLKAQQFKACAIIKNMIDTRNGHAGEITSLKERIKKLEQELEGVVTKHTGEMEAKSKNRFSKRVNKEVNAILDSTETTESEDKDIEHLESKVQELDKKIQEAAVQLQYLSDENTEMQSKLKEKNQQILDLENQVQKQCSEKIDKGSEKEEHSCVKLLEEKEEEIQRLKDELKKRTCDLQSIVNKELWEKNRQIEKLLNKNTVLLQSKEQEIVELEQLLAKEKAVLKEKDTAILQLQNKILDGDFQLNTLKSKIEELGIECEYFDAGDSDSLTRSTNTLQAQIQTLLKEKEIDFKKIQDLDNKLKLISLENPTDSVQIGLLRKQYEASEKLRLETTEMCSILSIRLKELAIFLDSLAKEKSVLGMLGSPENRKLRQAINESINVSNTWNMSLLKNTEQSLAELSDLTFLLDCTYTGDFTLSRIENSRSRMSNINIPSIVPEGTPVDDLDFKGRTSLDNLDAKSIRSRSQSKSIIRKSPRSSKSQIHRQDPQSDSESWSEPDINVSKARIGLFQEGVNPILSSDTTEEENTVAPYFEEPRLTIAELYAQISSLKQELVEKDNKIKRIEESHDLAKSLIRQENLRIKQELDKCYPDLCEMRQVLETTKNRKVEVENQLHKMQEIVRQLETAHNDLQLQLKESSSKFTEQIEHLEFEKTTLLNRAENSENELEKTRQELSNLKVIMEDLEQKLHQQQLDFLEELRLSNEKCSDKVKCIEEQCNTKIQNLTESLTEIQKERDDKETEIVKKNNEINHLTKQLSDLENSCSANQESVLAQLQSIKEELEKSNLQIQKKESEHLQVKNELAQCKEKINCLQEELESATLQYSEAVLHKTKLSNEKNVLEQELSKINLKEQEMKGQIIQVQRELDMVKGSYQQQMTTMINHRTKLELKVSELECCNAELQNKLIRFNTGKGDESFVAPLPRYRYPYSEMNIANDSERETSLSRQLSDTTTSCTSDDARSERRNSILRQSPEIFERSRANPSPDLGIESDQGRFSSLEVAQSEPIRPLLQALDITESMASLLSANQPAGNFKCENEVCAKRSSELSRENYDLKEKLLKTKKSLEETATRLSLANQRKKHVEKSICRQIHKTSQVLRKAKANLDSGSETDILKS